MISIHIMVSSFFSFFSSLLHAIRDTTSFKISTRWSKCQEAETVPQHLLPVHRFEVIAVVSSSHRSASSSLSFSCVTHHSPPFNAFHRPSQFSLLGRMLVVIDKVGAQMRPSAVHDQGSSPPPSRPYPTFQPRPSPQRPQSTARIISMAPRLQPPMWLIRPPLDLCHFWLHPVQDISTQPTLLQHRARYVSRDVVSFGAGP